MNPDEREHRTILRSIAQRAMLERGLLPDFSAEVIAELGGIASAASADGKVARDLTDLPWASIDNDDSLDLDQLTVAEPLPGGKVRILVALSDVDSLVGNGSAIDGHARHNTTSVYTAAQLFPMIPEKLCTNLTSLCFGEERLSLIVDMVIGADGSVLQSDIYRARVRNHAKLAYNSVAAWLDATGPLPDAVAAAPGLEENLRLQDGVAQSMKALRHTHGSLGLQTIEAKAVFEGEQLRGLEVEEKNRAKGIIEDFMIAANGVIARYLSARESPSIRRVVRTPKRWERIVELAEARGSRLPGLPDPKALEAFLEREKAADPLRFPDLSLSVIKLLGAGEYVAEFPGGPAPGHFGLAVREYTHSTAPNRRYVDLITQRLLKAALAGGASPYRRDELGLLAQHCTQQEDAADKVERQVSKSAAALLLESRVGQRFEALVTGASSKGTWVRLLDMPVEGMLVEGSRGVDVGDRVQVRLLAVDVDRGYIDFAKAGSKRR